jgi:hypothetical protein
MLIEHHPNHLN